MCTADMQVKEFPMDDHEVNGLNQIILLVGKRRTGKSWWIRDYLYTYRAYYPFGKYARLVRALPRTGFIFTKTKANGWYQQFFPSYLIFNEYDEDLIEKLVRVQEQRAAMNGLNRNIFILFDDFAAEQTIRYLQSFNRFAMYGRHWNVTCIFSTQRMTMAGTTLRSNTDKAVLFYNTDEAMMKTMYQEWSNEWRSFLDFKLFMAEHTKDNGCVVIDNKSNEARGPERVFTYKARDLDHVKFRLLCDQAWGEDAPSLLSRQRKEWKTKKDYKPSTLAKYMHQSGIPRKLLDGDTIIEKKLHDEDFSLGKIVGGSQGNTFTNLGGKSSAPLDDLIA